MSKNIYNNKNKSTKKNILDIISSEAYVNLDNTNIVKDISILDYSLDCKSNNKISISNSEIITGIDIKEKVNSNPSLNKLSSSSFMSSNKNKINVKELDFTKNFQVNKNNSILDKLNSKSIYSKTTINNNNSLYKKNKISILKDKEKTNVLAKRKPNQSSKNSNKSYNSKYSD